MVWGNQWVGEAAGSQKWSFREEAARCPNSRHRTQLIATGRHRSKRQQGDYLNNTPAWSASHFFPKALPSFTDGQCGLFWASPRLGSQPTHTTNGPRQAFQGVLTFSECFSWKFCEPAHINTVVGQMQNVTFPHMPVWAGASSTNPTVHGRYIMHGQRPITLP